MINGKRFKNLLAAGSSLARPTMGVAILMGALVLAMPQQLPAQQKLQSTAPSTSAPVTVTNTSANPVPVVGTVNVGGTPTVNAQISDNSATHPLLVRDVSDSTRVLFHKELNLSMDETQPGSQASFDVPTGKRLVIEHVSALVDLPLGQSLTTFRIAVARGAETTTMFFVPVPTGSDDRSHAAVSQQTHLISTSGGNAVTVGASRTGFVVSPLTQAVVFAEIDGYLVDAPQ